MNFKYSEGIYCGEKVRTKEIEVKEFHSKNSLILGIPGKGRAFTLTIDKINQSLKK